LKPHIAQTAPSKNHIVLDTNTLISNLINVQSLADKIEKHALPISIIIPGIVITELDSLKQGFKESAWRSRVASKWVLKKLLERQATATPSSVRGQAFTETCLRSRDWRKRSKGYEEETNDDLVLDCACYFSKDDARVWVWSGDVQLCAKSTMQSLLVLYDQDSLNVDAMLQAVQDGQSISPRQAMPRCDHHSPLIQNPRSRVDDDVGMDVDDYNLSLEDSEMDATSETLHPLDELHEQLVTHFTDLLREVAQRAAVAQAEWNAKAGSGLMASRYAPKYKDAVLAVPSASEITQLECSECIQFLSVVSPQIFSTDPRPFNQAAKPEHHEFTRLANFLKPPYNPGARRGRDWTREDWRDALALLEKAARYWQDVSTCESCSICRPVMENIFRTLDI